MDLYLNNKYLTTANGIDLHDFILNTLHLKDEEYYLVHNGKPVSIRNLDKQGIIHLVPRIFGGKGGFGSMLRAIGAQIEKTTNREACRDLSGRRLRDINEEKRLKAWIDSQDTREQEAADRRQKKLERLCQKPRHEFRDDTYDKERSELPERLEDAVAQGLAASSTSTVKRKSDSMPNKPKKKKALWVDDGMDDISSSSEHSTDSEEDTISKSRNTDEESSIKNATVNIESSNLENLGKTQPDKESSIQNVDNEVTVNCESTIDDSGCNDGDEKGSDVVGKCTGDNQNDQVLPDAVKA